MKNNQKGFSTILFILLLALIGGGYWIYSQGSKCGGDWNFAKVKCAVTNDQLANSYASAKHGISLRYPEGWFYDDNCVLGDSLLVAFGLKEKMIICYSDAPSGGPVTLYAWPKDDADIEAIAASMEAGLDDANVEKIQVGGVAATRISGTIRAHEGPGPEAGLDQIAVVFSQGNYHYAVIYIPVDDKDYTEIFNKIIGSITFK